MNIKSELTEYYKEDYNRVSALVDNFIDSFSTLGYIDLLLEETQRDSLVLLAVQHIGHQMLLQSN